MTRRRLGERCFTLIEALCALAIAAVLLAGISATILGTVRDMDAARAALSETRRLYGVGRILRGDMEGTFGVAGPQVRPFAMSTPVAKGGVVLEMATTRCLAPYGFVSVAGLQRVRYALRASEENPLFYELYRTQADWPLGRTIESGNDDEPDWELLADNVTFWRVECHNGKEWRDTWTSKSPPRALRLTMTLGVEENAARFAETFVVAPLVNPEVLPLALEMGALPD